jgi:hypothetical protein
MGMFRHEPAVARLFFTQSADASVDKEETSVMIQNYSHHVVGQDTFRLSYGIGCARHLGSSQRSSNTEATDSFDDVYREGKPSHSSTES